MEGRDKSWMPFVVDPRLAAGRGAEFSASGPNEDGEGEGDFDYANDHQVGGQTDDFGQEEASMDKAIDQGNVGFKLLQKMGWKGKGLGKNEDGILDPVRVGDKQERLGLGKEQEDRQYTDAQNICRKRLEVEIQADEDEERARKRQLLSEKEQRVKDDVQQAKQKFYCQICHKQYQTIMEWEAHLSSYDHHHKKRLSEMKAMVSGRKKKERMKREQRQFNKEMAYMTVQLQKAREQECKDIADSTVQRADLCGIPQDRKAIQFGLSMKKPSTTVPPKSIAKIGMENSKALTGKKKTEIPKVAAFADSDSDED